jgi:hypothetical protein
MALWRAIESATTKGITINVGSLLRGAPSPAARVEGQAPAGVGSSAGEIRRMLAAKIGGPGRLEIGYVDGKGDQTVRVIKPVEWIGLGERCVKALCYLRNGEEREFYVSRIQWAVPVP